MHRLQRRGLKPTDYELLCVFRPIYVRKRHVLDVDHHVCITIVNVALTMKQLVHTGFSNFSVNVFYSFVSHCE